MDSSFARKGYPLIEYYWDNHAPGVSGEYANSDNFDEIRKLEREVKITQQYGECPQQNGTHCVLIRVLPQNMNRPLQKPTFAVTAKSDEVVYMRAFILSSMLYSGDYDFDVPQVPLTNPDLNLAFDVLSNPRRPDSRLVVMSGGAGTFAILSLYQHRYMEWAGYARALFSFGQVPAKRSHIYYSTSENSVLQYRDNFEKPMNTWIQISVNPDFEIIEREVGTVGVSDIVNSLTAPHGLIFAFLAFLFGMGKYRATGILQQRLIKPSQWRSRIYTIHPEVDTDDKAKSSDSATPDTSSETTPPSISSTHSTPAPAYTTHSRHSSDGSTLRNATSTAPRFLTNNNAETLLNETEARIKALEDFRDMLRAHYVAIDNGLLPPSLHVLPEQNSRKRRLWFRRRKRPVSTATDGSGARVEDGDKDDGDDETSRDEDATKDGVKSVVVDIKHFPGEKV